MTVPEDVKELVRSFGNNGFRYLLKEVGNTADLIRWRKPEIASGMDFAHMRVEPDTFVASNFRELESDVLLSAPWKGKGVQANVQVYTLVEHQSEPDEHAMFRSTRYVVQIYDKQEKRWLQRHKNTRKLRFDPVLPIILYSGTRTWERPKPMRELVHLGALFGSMIPSLEPAFVNLAQTEAEVLQTQVGAFGWMLWLIQQKHATGEQFRETLGRVIQQLNPLTKSDPGRWRNLL